MSDETPFEARAAGTQPFPSVPLYIPPPPLPPPPPAGLGTPPPPPFRPAPPRKDFQPPPRPTDFQGGDLAVAESREQLGLAFFYALGTALAVAAVWVGIIVTAQRLFYYGAIFIGGAAAFAARKASPKAGNARGAVTAAATIVGLFVALYSGLRYLGGRGYTGLPLWLGFGTAFRIVKIAFTAEPMLGVCSLGSVVVAFFKGRS